MKRLHFTRCRTSLLAVLLAFSVAFVPVPSISDTSSNSAALLTTAQAAKKNTKNSFSLNEVPKYNGKASVVVHGSPILLRGKSKTPKVLSRIINLINSDAAVSPMPM